MSASTDAKANARMIIASFAAGVGAMMFLGLVAPTIIKGGLSLTAANASTIEAQAPAIAPLDVAAIRAQLAEAELDMASVRATTDDDVARLARLSH
jgi:ABC-type cobalamin transport system permease subunit